MDKMINFARLFDTKFGQLLATIELDDEDETYGVRLRMDTTRSGSVSITHGGWESRANAEFMLRKIEQYMIEEQAAAITKMAGVFIFSDTDQSPKGEGA